MLFTFLEALITSCYFYMISIHYSFQLPFSSVTYLYKYLSVSCGKNKMGKPIKTKKKAAAAAKKKEMEELALQEQAAVEDEYEFQKTCLEIRIKELETLNLGYKYTYKTTLLYYVNSYFYNFYKSTKKVRVLG